MVLSVSPPTPRSGLVSVEIVYTIVSARWHIFTASPRPAWLKLSCPSDTTISALRTDPGSRRLSICAWQVLYSASYSAVVPPGRSLRIPSSSFEIFAV